jgi:hypothetical protein
VLPRPGRSGRLEGRTSETITARLSTPRVVTGDRRDWKRPVLFGAAVVILAAGLVVGVLTWQSANAVGRVGADLRLYLEATHTAGGGRLLPGSPARRAVAIADGDILYPPLVIILFVPFLVLPAVLSG